MTQTSLTQAQNNCHVAVEWVGVREDTLGPLWVWILCWGLIRVSGDQSTHWRVSNSVEDGYPKSNGVPQGNWLSVWRSICVITAYLCPVLVGTLMQETSHPFEIEDFEGS